MKTIIRSSKLPAPVGPYSIAVQSGSLVFLSGQIAINPENGEVTVGNVEKEAEIILDNISLFLSEQNLSFENVLKTTIFLIDMQDFAKVNQIYAQRFTDNPPARSCIAVQGLPKGVSIEMEMIIDAGN